MSQIFNLQNATSDVSSNEAFTYMFKDNKFFQKASFYFLFAFLSVFGGVLAETAEGDATLILLAFIIWILGLISNLFLSGYFISAIRALRTKSENFVLPMFNMGKTFILGLKCFLSMIILEIVVGIGLALVCCVIGIIMAVFAKSVFSGVAIGKIFVYKKYKSVLSKDIRKLYCYILESM